MTVPTVVSPEPVAKHVAEQAMPETLVTPAGQANAAGEPVMACNARKQQVIREIYHRGFPAAGRDGTPG
jgi:hypothetical protein